MGTTASHLEAELTRRKAPVRFVRYDAFKFARLPLQRHFIRYLATKLGVSDKDFHDHLYEDVESSDLTLEDLAGSPKGRLALNVALLVLGVLGLALTIAMAFTAASALIGSWASDKNDFGELFTEYLRGHLVGYLAPAGLLTLFGVLVSQKLTFKRGRKAPTSEDQFARLFEQLVDSALKAPLIGAGPDRLVVFIDELDRCDPRTVVATLDSLRTFLDASRCVFIVAADQQVLETALTAQVQQATPTDLTNPYYSAGSEYLDKTFHYQLSIPPLPSRRLSNYAAALVRGKPGPWSDVPSVDRVVSLLIPNHVRSPRRAKTLLNAYALLYELAGRRCAAGVLTGPPRGRADEIAVLACLRVEFPLFARELDREPKLIDAYRAVADGLGQSGFDDELWELAQDFHSGRRASDVVIPAPATSVAPALAVVEGSEADEDTEEIEPIPSAANGSSAAIRKAQSRLLTLYLSKTRTVPGPGRDLVHLEGSGAFLGIDPAIVERLEDAASQADQATVNRIVERLGVDGRMNALRALATNLDREPPVGVEIDNVITTLLQLYATATDSERAASAFAEISSIVASAIGRYDAYELAAEDLPGALSLGLDSDIAGTALVNHVLGHEAAAADAAVMLRVVDAFGHLGPSLLPGARALLAAGLRSNAARPEVEERIAALPHDESLHLVNEVAPTLAEDLKAAVELVHENEDLDDAGKASAIRGEVDALLNLFANDGHVAQRQRIAAALLAVAGTAKPFVEFRNAVFHRLSDLAESPESGINWGPLVAAVLNCVYVRPATDISAAIGGVDHLAVPAEVRQAAGGRIVEQIWSRLVAPYAEPKGFGEALAATADLLDVPLAPDSPTATAISASIAAPTTGAEASAMLSQLGLLGPLLASGVIEPTAVVADLGVKAAGVIAAVYVAPEPAAGLAEWVVAACGLVGRHGTTETVTAMQDAVAAATLLTAEQITVLLLDTYVTASERGIDVESPLTVDELLALDLLDDSALRALGARWLLAAAPAPADGARVITTLAGRQLAAADLERIRAYADGLPDDTARGDVIRVEMQNVLTALPRRDVLEALGLDRIDDEIAAGLLLDVFTNATNRDQRKWVIDAWEAARITADKARVRLLQQIMIPTGNSGSSGIATVIRYIELCRNPPHGTKGPIQALRIGLDKDDRERLEKAFVSVGLGATKARLLRGPEYRDT